MAASLPSLSLSDIMHPLSPPPPPVSPTKPVTPPPRPRSSTPEPLEPAEIEEMRRRVIGMGWGGETKGKQSASEREQELADMLLRLTHPASLPQASQLHAQAETIANLIQQRDFLVQRSMEERERWESERESWARAAQALILQGRKGLVQAEKDENDIDHYGMISEAATLRIQEYERVNLALQNDKKMLQQKLQDTQTRLATLESELAQLRPILLMQPFALMHSHPTGSQRGWTASLPNISPARRVHNPDTVMETYESDDESILPHLQPRAQFRNPVSRSVGPDQQQTPLQSAFPSSPRKGDYYRRREVPASSTPHPHTPMTKAGRRKGPVSHAAPPRRPILSDARAEHLLLAARKIGMQRATFLSGAFDHLQNPLPEPTPQPSKAARRPTSPSKLQTPKTPRRNVPANTPLLTRTPLGISPGQPRTPLQSLLSAAQSVLSAPGSMSMEPPESPLAKRRKLDHSVGFLRKMDSDTPFSKKDKGKSKGKETEKEKEKATDMVEEKDIDEKTVDSTKVKSALDLLADEAEARGTRPPSAEADVDDVDGDDVVQHDVDMEDGSGTRQVADVEPKEVDVGRHKDNADLDSQFREIEADADLTLDETGDQSQETALESQGGEFASQASTSFIHSKPPEPALTQAATATSAPTSRGSPPLNRPDQSTEGSMLAPPINLTPRASRSPAPSDAQHPSSSRNGSRAQSVERFSSLDSGSASGGSFTMFSLQRPQPLAAAGPSSVSASSSGVVEDQGPSMLLTSRIEGVKFINEDPPRRIRSPYIKWTKEEDDLLAKAVAKYGQKWDLVQKELPSRGYHQVRQRWLRKLGVFDGSKLDLSSPETNAAADFLNMSTALLPHNVTETQLAAYAKDNLEKGPPDVDMGPDDLDEDAEAEIDLGDEMEQMPAD